MTRDNKPVSNPAEPTRRSFLGKLWLGLGGVALASYTSAGVAFLWPGKSGGTDDDRAYIIEAGPVDKFPTNSITAFVRGRFYLCRLDDGGFLAISRKCTHLGCTVLRDKEGKSFECPCHASTFDMTGAVLSAPAPRPLDLFEVSIQNNIVKVDTGATVRRASFEASQVVHPGKV
jgi:cytochrome b6-f complex iron-sulfur subunit